MAVKIIVLWGLIALTAMVAAGILAAYKNRDYSFWMGWCFLLPPAVLLLLVLPRRKGPVRRRRTLDEEDALLP